MPTEALLEWEAFPEWLYPPPAGWTADDLDHLPPGAPRFELLDGALIPRAPQTRFHSRVTRRLADAVEDAAPRSLTVEMRMTLKLAKRQRPEPDIVVLNAPADPARTWYRPDEVVLVAEIVSEESAERDHFTKPLRYAQAGIHHFWRVENEADEPVVYVYELDIVTGAYVATSIHRQQLKLSVPFPMDIDLTKLYRR